MLYFNQPMEMTEKDFIEYWNNSYCAPKESKCGWLSPNGYFAKVDKCAIGDRTHYKFAIEYLKNLQTQFDKADDKLINLGFIRITYNSYKVDFLICNAMNENYKITDAQFYWLKENNIVLLNNILKEKL